ncbi:MAG TPA: hypothetical protein VJ300_02515 [Thermoplasmata archaeon]|nr:hypothetical protein [Thermoplasmata archaeon]
MAFPTFAVVGFAVPLALLGANLVLGYGGVLATIALFVWLGLSIVLLPTEETA